MKKFNKENNSENSAITSIFEKEGMYSLSAVVEPGTLPQIYKGKKISALYTGIEIYTGPSTYFKNPKSGNYGEEITVGIFIIFDRKIWEFTVLKVDLDNKRDIESNLTQKGWIVDSNSEALGYVIARRRKTLKETESLSINSDFPKEKLLFERRKRRRGRRRKRKCSLCQEESKQTGKKLSKCKHREISLP